jgi:hypothetical protein
LNVVAALAGGVGRIRSPRGRLLGSVYDNDDMIARATVTEVEGDRVTLEVSLPGGSPDGIAFDADGRLPARWISRG